MGGSLHLLRRSSMDVGRPARGRMLTGMDMDREMMGMAPVVVVVCSEEEHMAAGRSNTVDLKEDEAVQEAVQSATATTEAQADRATVKAKVRIEGDTVEVEMQVGEVDLGLRIIEAAMIPGMEMDMGGVEGQRLRECPEGE